MTPTTDSTQKPKDNSHELLRAELTDVVVQQLGIKGPEAIVTAEALLRGLMTRLGGQGIYIPAPPRSERNAAILGDFKGNNAAEVCTKHGISRRTLYRILTNRADQRQIVTNLP
jgi:Mor family transcriptional regulator